MARPSPSKREGSGGANREKQSETRKRRVRAATAAASSRDFLSESSSLSRRIAELEKTLGSLPPAPRTAGTHHTTVPKTWVKLIAGVLLLPFALILTMALLGTLKTSVEEGVKELLNMSFSGDLKNSELKNFVMVIKKHMLGCVVAGMVFFGVFFAVSPRRFLMIPYVFGHEVTHALWVKLFGGSVANRFHVSLEGGHVMTDKVNTWIILSPYFFPFYSMIAATLYGVLLASAKILDLACKGGDLLQTVWSGQWFFWAVIGFTLAFHLVFTFLLVTRSQPDLHYGGTFFSLVVIYMINLLIITGLFLITCRQQNLWDAYDLHFRESTQGFVETCENAGIWLLSSFRKLWALTAS